MIDCVECGRPIVKKNGDWIHLGRKLRHPAVLPKELPQNRELSFFDIIFRTDFNSDCGGAGFEWVCPDCGEKVYWAPSMWWELDCSCRNWDFEMVISGELKEEYK